MSLRAVIRAVEGQEKTLTVLNPPDESFVEDLRAYFKQQNLSVEGAETTSGRPGSLAVLSRGDDVLTAVSCDDLRELMSSTPAGAGGLGFDDSAYYEFLQYVKETTFTSYSIADMVAASHEIEDRAWRTGEGRLFAGFQYFSTLQGQRQTYADLSKKGIEIHVYGYPDVEAPDVGDAVVHGEEAEEIETTWFVVYDGGASEHNKSALLAEERGDREFYGFWTYNPDIVDRIVDHLETNYGLVSQ